MKMDKIDRSGLQGDAEAAGVCKRPQGAVGPRRAARGNKEQQGATKGCGRPRDATGDSRQSQRPLFSAMSDTFLSAATLVAVD
jgi:hypothetical protein